MLTNVQIECIQARKHRGFSMMDVLIAILVLAVGLLALGVLQGTLTRNAADARIRSQVAAFSQGVTDKLRAGGYSAFPASSTVTANTTVCAGTSLTSLQTYACQWLNSAGVSSVSTTITTTTNYGSTGGTWSTTAPSGLSGASAQYKQVNISTTWTDAQGQTRTLAYDTSVSQVTVNPSDGSLDTSSFLTSTVSPSVREGSPGNIPGVIPIAIGTSGTSTVNAAATNPQPVQTNTGTTFSQYTYNDSTLGGELITQRVDTKVIQCRCKFAAGTGSGGLLSTGIPTQPNQPTYWDGYHYVSPSQNKSVQVTTSGTGSGMTYASNTSADPAYASTNDTSCDVCCRDRNDPDSATTSNPVLFDPFSGDNKKYAFSATKAAAGTNPPLDSVTSGSFQQACRLIRVDGVYATATDAHVDFFSFLPTDTCANAKLPTTCANTSPATTTSQTGAIPSSTTEASYATFVQNYLTQNISALASATGVVSSAWGSGSPQTTSGTGSSAASSFIGYNLNQPTSVTIDPSAKYDPWLYARAVYVDHVESAARTAISTVGANCTGANCVLQYVPFTTVNLSGLGNNVPTAASSSPASVIIVSNTAVVGGAADGSAPVQGYVTPYSSTKTGSANGIYTSYVTNASLTGVQPTYSGTTLTSTPANSTYDATNTLFDQRQFVVGASTSCTGSPVYFDVNLGGLTYLSQSASLTTYNSNFGVSWTGPACGSGSTTGYLTPTGTYPVLLAGGSLTTPIAVPTSTTPSQTAPIAVTVQVAGFNTSSAVTKAYGNDTETCTPTNANGAVSATLTFTNVATQCYGYAVNTSGISINGNAVTGATVVYSGTSGGMQQTASITFPSGSGISSTTNAIPGADNVVIPFTLQTTTIAPGKCVCGNKSCSLTRATYTPGTCPN